MNSFKDSRWQNIYETPNYDRFYLITLKDGSNIAEIDVIKANKQLEQKLRGKPRKVNETRAGGLLIEVKNKEQSEAIQTITTLAGKEILVQAHATLNQTKGTIRYANKPNYSPEEILAELKQFQATAIYQTKRRQNGALVNQPI